MLKPLILIGGGGHARSCADVIDLEGIYKIEGVVDFQAKDMMGYKFLGGDENLPELVSKYPSTLITIGQINSSKSRRQMYQKLLFLGADMPTIVSPLAFLSRRSQVGVGCILMHGSIVNANANIGNNCIINSQALIEHDVSIGSHCHISTGAKVNGGVNIGDDCFIGSGSIIHQGVSIGRNCVIAAGSVIKRNISDNSVFRGD
jgi:sugar O-acyltransferase (sialic acid O-acetyltransferase NeuD family)